LTGSQEVVGSNPIFSTNNHICWESISSDSSLQNSL